MWPTLIPIMGNLLDKIFPNAKDAADAKLKIMEMAQAGELAALDADLKMAQGQMDINKAEAASGNLYASSWRPTIGYICAVGLAYNFLGYPILAWIAAIWKPGMVIPPLFDNNLFELVLGMLGLAGFRTYEKVKGLGK